MSGTKGAPGAKGWERLFALVFERSTNPMVLLDGARQIVAANNAAAELFGRPRAELEGRSIAETIVPEERARAAEEWRKFLRTGEYEGSRDLMTADGKVVHVRFAARFANVGGRRLAVYVVLSGDKGDAALVSGGEGPLTTREREIVSLIALGHDTRGIAEELGISAETVRTHVRNAMAKLGAHTRAQLVAHAMCAAEALHPAMFTGS